MAGVYHLTGDAAIEQGATFTRTFTWLDENDDPYDITGYTARMQIRLKKESPSTIASLTTENGGVTITGASGIIAVTISASDTAAMDFKTAFYDLELINGSTVTRLLEGEVELDKEVTR